MHKHIIITSSHQKCTSSKLIAIAYHRSSKINTNVQCPMKLKILDRYKRYDPKQCTCSKKWYACVKYLNNTTSIKITYQGWLVESPNGAGLETHGLPLPLVSGSYWGPETPLLCDTLWSALGYSLGPRVRLSTLRRAQILISNPVMLNLPSNHESLYNGLSQRCTLNSYHESLNNPLCL